MTGVFPGKQNDTRSWDILIAGAGHAGAMTALQLRQKGFEGSIALLGAEPHYPYERPPLSKAYPASDVLREKLYLRKPAMWQERFIDLFLSTSVTKIDLEKQICYDQNGIAFGYGVLVWAAGASPNPLPMVPLDRMQQQRLCFIRSLDDSDAVRLRLADAEHIAILGGGYIGLEAAAVLARLGKKVTPIEAQKRLLARVSTALVADFYQSLHERNGVRVLLDCSLLGLCSDQEGLHLELEQAGNRSSITADFGILGIGVRPTTSVLADAGVKIDPRSQAVCVDGFFKTSSKSIYALGDCISQFSPWSFANPEPASSKGCVPKGYVNVQSIPQATEQAKFLANYLVDPASCPQGFQALPWFWSDQYDVKLQSIGLLHGFDSMVVRGDGITSSLSVFYLLEGRMIAADCISRPQYSAAKEFAAARRWILSGAKNDYHQLADCKHFPEF